jgi:hypothetical protein
MTKIKIAQLITLLKEFKNSDYIGLGEMEIAEDIDGIVSWLNEIVKE